MLLIALCLRLVAYTIEPLAGVLLMAHASDGPVPVAAARAWWDGQCPEDLRQMTSLNWQGRLDLVWFHFSDCGIWRFEGDDYVLTDLGRDFLIAYINAMDSGLFDD